MKQHILCFGDSNTHGYCPEPGGCDEFHLLRYNESERWTCRLQAALGDDYLIIEEGLSGRTTVFHDPLKEGMCGLDYLAPCLMSHAPISLLILMLGTNDVKERFSVNAPCIALGMGRLVEKAKQTPCWVPGTRPNILLIAPPPIGDGFLTVQGESTMGHHCVEKSRQLAQEYEKIAQLHGCHFLDARSADAQFNQFDFSHLTREGHANLAHYLTHYLPTIL